MISLRPVRELTGLCAALALAPQVGWTAERPVTMASPAAPLTLPIASQPLAQRIVPLMHHLSHAPGWHDALRTDADLRALTVERAKRVTNAENCTPQPACLAQGWMWSESDIARVSSALRRIGMDKARLQGLVGAIMRPSRLYARNSTMTDDALLDAAWREAAAGINGIIATYALGTPPRYPAIDSIIFNPQDAAYLALLKTHTAVTLAEGTAQDSLFDPVLRYAMGLLAANERTHAAELLPLSSGPNRPAFAALGSMDQKPYPYSAILVFGHGPEDPISRTGVLGHLRLRIAAAQLAKGLAPVIILSGGRVHPNRTGYNEAVEMRQELIDLYGVAPERIVMEPHARHTTTNLRNCARLLLDAPFAQGKPALIVTDPTTHAYIGGTVLAERNRKELGYEPGQVRAGPDALSLQFIPDFRSFHIDPLDPLDP